MEGGAQLSHGCSGPSPTCPGPTQVSDPHVFPTLSPDTHVAAHPAAGKQQLTPHVLLKMGSGTTRTCCVGPAALSLEAGAVWNALVLISE